MECCGSFVSIVMQPEKRSVKKKPKKTKMDITTSNAECTKEAAQLLKQANFEIRSLRRQNELMRARLDMFDSINAILHTTVARQNEGMSEDLCQKIDKFSDDYEKFSK